MTIATGRKIVSPQIAESVQAKKGLWTHHIILESRKDIDKDVENLITESYNFYLKRLERKRELTTGKKAGT